MANLKVRFTQILPPISRVRVSLSVLTFFRSLVDIARASENAALNLTRPVEPDFTSISDNATLQSNLGPKETQLISELITKIDTNKVLSDISSIVDNIPKDFSKVLSDQYVSIDQINFEQTKSLIDSFVSEDQNVIIDLQKKLIDSITIPVLISFIITKILEDQAVVLDDSILSSIKSLSDQSNIDEQTVRDVIKSLTDFSDTDDILIYNFDKVLADLSNTSDDQSFNFNKILEDAIETVEDTNLFDGSLVIFNKRLSISSLIAETLQRTVDYNRTFTENLSVPENTDLTVTKPFSNITETVDTEILSVSKPFSEILQSIDNFSRIVSYILKPTDLVETEELPAKTVEKPFADSISFVETVLVSLVFFVALVDSFSTADDDTIQFNKARFETLESIDLFVREVLYERIFEENPVLPDVINFIITKILSDNYTPVDLLALVFSKILSDSFTHTDDQTLNFTKFVSDLLESVDSIDAFDFNKVLNDVTNIIEQDSKNFTKILADQGNIDQDIFLAISKALSDQLDSVDDIQSFSFNKILSDFAETQEDTNLFDGSLYIFVKSLNDNSSVIDLADLTISFIREFFETVNSTDQLTNDVAKSTSDEANTSFTIDYSLNKSVSDITQTPDDPILSITKILDDIFVPQDTFSFSITIPRSDTIDTVSETVINNNKLVVDITETTESGNLISQSYALEDYFAENYVGQYVEF